MNSSTTSYPALPHSPIDTSLDERRHHRKRSRASPSPSPKLERNKHNRRNVEPVVVSKPPGPTVSDIDGENEYSRSRNSKQKSKQTTSDEVISTEQPKGLKNPKDYTDKKANAVNNVLGIPLSRPYEILGLPETANKKQVKKAFKELSRLVHPDKNSHPNAADASQKVNNAFKKLSEDNEHFAENAFDNGWDSRNSEGTNDEGERDMDGDTRMRETRDYAEELGDDIEDRPTPKTPYKRVYAECTPYMRRLMENPDDNEAKKYLKNANETIRRINMEANLPKNRQGSYIIPLEAFTSLCIAVQQAADNVQKNSSEDREATLSTAQKKIRDANYSIREIVKGARFPQDWIIQFELSETGELLQHWAAEQQGDSLRHLGKAGTARTAKWKPGQTTDGEEILSYREIKSRVGDDVIRREFIVRPNPGSHICEIKSGMEIGLAAMRAFLNMKDKPPVFGQKPRDLNNEDWKYFRSIMDVASLNPPKGGGNRPHTECHIGFEQSSEDGIISTWTRWVNRSRMIEGLGKRDADTVIDNMYYQEEATPPWAREPNLKSEDDLSESDSWRRRHSNQVHNRMRNVKPKKSRRVHRVRPDSESSASPDSSYESSNSGSSHRLNRPNKKENKESLSKSSRTKMITSAGDVDPDVEYLNRKLAKLLKKGNLKKSPELRRISDMLNDSAVESTGRMLSRRKKDTY